MLDPETVKSELRAFVCRELIHAMGGRVWALARPDRGAEFGFALPIFDPETDAAAA